MASFFASLAASSAVDEKQLRYMLNGSPCLIHSTTYDELLNIWKVSVGGLEQIPDPQVAKTLELSGLSHEVLGEIWEEASQAIILDKESSTEMQMDAMYWKDFLILLHFCYQRSGVDLNTFVSRFQPKPPTTRHTSMRGKTNPFAKSHGAKAHSGSNSPFLSGDRDANNEGWHPNMQIPPSWQSTNSGSSSPLPILAEAGDSRHVSQRSPVQVSQYAQPNSSQPQVSRSGRKEELSHRQVFESGLEVAYSPPPNAPEVVPTLNASGYHVQSHQTKAVEQSRQIEIPSRGKPNDDKLLAAEIFPHTPGTNQSRRSPVVTNTTPVSELYTPHCTPESLQIAKNRLKAIQGEQSGLTSPTHMNSNNLRTSLQASMKKRLSLKPRKDLDQRGEYTLPALATGLERAATEGRLDIIEAFLELGADVNWRTKEGKGERHRALSLAAKEGRSEVVDYLISRGADGVSLNEALVCATAAGKSELATRMITVHHASVDSAIFTKELQEKNNDYDTEAALSITYRDAYIKDKNARVEFLKLLISRGCHVNAPCWKIYKAKSYDDVAEDVKEETFGFGYSPLGMFIGGCVCSQSVDLLLRTGADVYTTPHPPPPSILTTFTTRSPTPILTLPPFQTIQPLSCLPSTAWKTSLSSSIKITTLLLFHGSTLNHYEANGIEEMHPGEGKTNFPVPMTPLKRAQYARSNEGIEFLKKKGALEEPDTLNMELNMRGEMGRERDSPAEPLADRLKITLTNLRKGSQSHGSISTGPESLDPEWETHLRKGGSKVYINPQSRLSSFSPPLAPSALPNPLPLPLKPPREFRDTINCDHCKKKITTVIIEREFYRCDTCDRNSFDLCGGCLGEGKWCKVANHWLRIAMTRGERYYGY